jgi:hypothetical protein
VLQRPLPDDALRIVARGEKMASRSKRSCRTGATLFAAVLLTSPVCADSPDISARRLLSSWRDGDPSMRGLAEVIASAFASGLSWRGSVAGKEVYCPPAGLKGQQIMSALEQFLGDNPDLAEKPYGDAMAATLVRAFPCHSL